MQPFHNTLVWILGFLINMLPVTTIFLLYVTYNFGQAAKKLQYSKCKDKAKWIRCQGWAESHNHSFPLNNPVCLQVCTKRQASLVSKRADSSQWLNGGN
ncbi:hypothetical protein BDV23DRAFT_159222 [Aspergillus alliaceus]|uniref:Uncharacterized protein n=1 Tax=Petromyces alliaceus TaxID=209559 RepID=A0A5N7C2P6_PETAA|nr:hypothetical protein BDV23DRAFT_159222 [Aspergillus alliaceus]